MRRHRRCCVGPRHPVVTRSGSRNFRGSLCHCLASRDRRRAVRGSTECRTRCPFEITRAVVRELPLSG